MKYYIDKSFLDNLYYDNNLVLYPEGGKTNTPIKGTKEQYQAYQDSLDLYNSSHNRLMNYITTGAKIGNIKPPDMNFTKTNDKRIIPINTYTATYDRGNGLTEGYMFQPAYKKPVQPIIYTPKNERQNPLEQPQVPFPNTTNGQFNRTISKIRPKQTTIQIESKKADLLPTSPMNLEIERIPFTQGTYFTRDRQNQEQGSEQFGRAGKIDYFDKKTGKLLGTYQVGGKLPKAQTGKITLDEFRPKFANSNANIQQGIQKRDNLKRRSIGKESNPIQLSEVTVTAPRQLDPSKKAFGTVYPDKTGNSAELASALFPIGEYFHTPSRLVNQAISLGKGKGFAPYDSEISETLGWQNNDPTDLWAGARNFVVNNAADVLIPIEGVSQPSARFLTNLGEGVVEGAKAYGRSLGNTKRILRDYRLNQTPNFITPQNEELLSTVRNVGMSLKGEGDLYNPKILQNVLNRANSLNNTQFKNLTGFEKSEIEERIQKLLTGELKKPEPVASPTVDGLTREEFIRQQLIDLRRPERRQRLQELSTNIGRQNPTGWQTIESNITRPGDYDIDVINNSVDISRIAAEPNMFLHYYNEPNFNIVDKFNEKITERLNKKLGLIEKTEKPIDTKSLISGLYAREGEGAVRKKLLQAIKQVEGAKKGETFLASTSLSSDSYPLAHKFLPKMLKEGKVDVSYHGMQDLNTLGFANELGLPKNITLEEINTVIDNINKASGKRFPYAKIENKSIQVPIISATRKKYGGKISLKNKQAKGWQIID